MRPLREWDVALRSLGRVPLAWLLLAGLTGCGRTVYYECEGVASPPARRAYYEQRTQCKADTGRPDLSEADPQEKVLNLCDCDCKAWERQPYETVEEWVERLHHEMCSNRDQLIGLLHDLDTLKAHESDITASVQDYIHKNQILKEMRSSMATAEAAQTSFKEVAVSHPAPFVVHIVKPGDTLYSISVRYYGSGDMVSTIVAWNQGWIRDPNDIVAGLGLVLFERHYTGSAQKEVDGYLREVESIQ